MPARSNSFQRFIKHIHAIVAPLALVRRESEIISDDGNDREIDIYVEIPTFAQVFKIAIECRDHGRPQDIGWIDSLIGKTIDLKLDKVIAVSSSGYTKAAAKKAKKHKIDLLTLEEAEKVDWALKFHDPNKKWEQLTHKFSLCRLWGFGVNREILIEIIADDPKAVKYSNDLSKDIHSFLYKFFMDNYAGKTQQEFDKLLYGGEEWLRKFDDSTPNYFEIEFNGFDGISADGEIIPIRFLRFGVLVDYKIQPTHEAAEVMGDHLIRTFELPRIELGLPERTFISLVSDKDGRFIGTTSYVENEPFQRKRGGKKSKKQNRPRKR